MTISNNMGPPIPLFCAGAKVAAIYPVSIPAHGVALNVTVNSYIDKLDFGITADYAAMPDPDYFVSLMDDALEELKTAVAKTAGANSDD